MLACCQLKLKIERKSYCNSHNSLTSDLTFSYWCFTISEDQRVSPSYSLDGVRSDCLQNWITFNLTRFYFILFLNYYWTCKAPYLSASSHWQPFIIIDTRHHTTSPSLGTLESFTLSFAVFVGSSPWSLSPEHKSNSDATELRGLSSLMGSQIISSGIFFLLTLRIPLEILPFHPQQYFLNQSGENPRMWIWKSEKVTNASPSCVSARGHLMFHLSGPRLCFVWLRICQNHLRCNQL